MAATGHRDETRETFANGVSKKTGTQSEIG
jgi:hypothetical protein